ncbi:bifunctional metallophosphatase/5'-nucleotidase [Brevibacillus ruminantium]|uniref:Bifunctional metallophosphatase/5'-nucleotidase n=1 Tax=Brevibacillus ruminantium TaxID=2950604 RepID=A0ABY4WLP8_9BACL|nr:bifunctional UDP-sugar hydrolase/5'-nucleotidase [Brevibacillus ruminantium]USG66775.1 bifunctional metallophosphatase/5'-nucleotidase [Brevibacillus ruminantium]
MADTCTLHILHTNDVHSRFSSMPHIASCLRQHRDRWEALGEHVLTVDIGDHADRMDVRTEATWGQLNVEVLNRSGYQYVTIGNNEGITLPKARLDALYERAGFTVVLGNMVDADTGKVPRWAVTQAIHEWEDLRVGILGVTAPFVQFYQLLGWETKAPFELLREQIAALRSSVDLVILLSHLGYPEDCRLAQEIEGVDIILGAHTHHQLAHGERVKETLIAQTGMLGTNVGHIRLVWDREAHKVQEASAELFPSTEYPADPDLSAYLAQEQKNTERLLERTAVRLSVELSNSWTEETSFGSALAASLRQWTQAEVGLANNGLLLTPLSGEVSYGDLLRCLPHPINPCAVSLTGEQLSRVLMQSIQPQVIQRELRGFGFRGKVTGWMGIDGLQVWYEAGEQPRIARIEVNGELIDSQRCYRVGTIDMFMFNRLFPDLAEGTQIHYYLPELLREILAQTLNDEALLTAAQKPRWLNLARS